MIIITTTGRRRRREEEEEDTSITKDRRSASPAPRCVGRSDDAVYDVCVSQN
jgi:hypothetical protein